MKEQDGTRFHPKVLLTDDNRKIRQLQLQTGTEKQTTAHTTNRNDDDLHELKQNWTEKKLNQTDQNQPNRQLYHQTQRH